MKNNKATPSNESSPIKQHDNNNSIKSQQSRTLSALQHSGGKGKTTIELRENYDIMNPAPRIFELRGAGYPIETIWTVSENAQGNKHRCARYVLLATETGAQA